MFYLLLTAYCLLFTYLTWKNFHSGLFLLFLLLPTYLIRFNIGPLPTTLLEVMIWILIIIWLIKYNRSIIFNLKSLILNHKSLFIAVALFLIAATISVFTSIDLRAAAGEWKAFYFEPILVFIILITSLNKNNFNNNQKISNFQISPATAGSRLHSGTISKQFSIYKFLNFQISNPINIVIYALILSGLFTSLLAIYQHFTGWLVPYSFWQNHSTFRVTAWYGFPNAVGLFLAPLVPLVIYLIIQ